jgi:hypothetical protein
VPYMMVTKKATSHSPVTIRPVGNTLSIMPGITKGVGRPCAAAMIFWAGLLRRKEGSVRLPEPVVKRPATNDASVGESCDEATEEELMAAFIDILGVRMALNMVLSGLA